MATENGLDEDLLREAKELTGISDTATVLDEALNALIRARDFSERLERRREAYQAALKSGATREEAQEHANRF
ncbi:MAG: type II toxin-antitoxin system VapB family antitoxin [Armatimonadota bacterium]